MAAWVAQRHPPPVWWCPQLPPSPRAAAQLIAQGTASWPGESMAVIGSSLGGFYATWLAEQRQCRAVLLNPAVDPARDLANHLGEQTLWHQPQEHFYFQAEYVDELRVLRCGGPSQPDHYLCVIAKGDELLDWHEMTARYPGTHTKLLPTGDHALSDFDEHIGQIGEFLGLD